MKRELCLGLSARWVEVNREAVRVLGAFALRHFDALHEWRTDIGGNLDTTRGLNTGRSRIGVDQRAA